MQNGYHNSAAVNASALAISSAESMPGLICLRLINSYSYLTYPCFDRQVLLVTYTRLGLTARYNAASRYARRGQHLI
jgi:hypothetical protein